MTTEFPPTKVIDIVNEVSSLLKERKETISVAETVSLTVCTLLILSRYGLHAGFEC